MRFYRRELFVDAKPLLRRLDAPLAQKICRVHIMLPDLNLELPGWLKLAIRVI